MFPLSAHFYDFHSSLTRFQWTVFLETFMAAWISFVIFATQSEQLQLKSCWAFNFFWMWMDEFFFIRTWSNNSSVSPSSVVDLAELGKSSNVMSVIVTVGSVSLSSSMITVMIVWSLVSSSYCSSMDSFLINIFFLRFSWSLASAILCCSISFASFSLAILDLSSPILTSQLSSQAVISLIF